MAIKATKVTNMYSKIISTYHAARCHPAILAVGGLLKLAAISAAVALCGGLPASAASGTSNKTTLKLISSHARSGLKKQWKGYFSTWAMTIATASNGTGGHVVLWLGVSVALGWAPGGWML